MDPKYSNIFWHQGIKIFEQSFLKSTAGRIRMEHLENDVTKALLNLFQHCSGKVLGAFLSLLGVKGRSETFDFDFQITGESSFSQKPHKIMLALISSSTRKASDPSYVVEQSRPDACIYNKDTAILIEAKTQAPLVTEQLESHIRHYLGSGTIERTITWEAISEKFGIIRKRLPRLDQVLVAQFCEFLELIGIAEFNGFTKSDFSMLGSIGKVPSEDYLDLKRMLGKKVEKFMKLLDEAIGPGFWARNNRSRVSKVDAIHPGLWSAFYFYDEEPDIHVNHYPNVNLRYNEGGIELSLNAEIQNSVKHLLTNMEKNVEIFENISSKLSDFTFSAFYKLQYLPMDHFVWNLIPGYPKPLDALKSAAVLSSIKAFEMNWPDFRNTLLYEMKSGMLKHASGRFFTQKEIDFANKMNSKPTYAVGVGKRYAASQIDKQGKTIVKCFRDEIRRLRPLSNFVIS